MISNGVRGDHGDALNDPISPVYGLKEAPRDVTTHHHYVNH